MSSRAWVTLATNDSYGLGALVLAHSLRRVGSTYPSVVLITPSVTEAMRDRLRAVFADVVIVDVLDSGDAAHLALLQRPELGITFTKLHCWNLTQYEKCVFLDADTLVVQNCDELFDREQLSAAPDVGWPDCFNSGVFVFTPSAETFSKLIKFAQERGSFDGGDQGLLNSFFSDWAHGDISKHLPFLYNVTSAAFYSYLPALKHYGQNLKIIHFIGAAKPWLQRYNFESGSVDAPDHLREFLQMWWDIFVSQVHTQLDIAMVEIEAAQEASPSLPPEDVSQQFYYQPNVDPKSEFPWHHPDSQNLHQNESQQGVDTSEFHDPWDLYYRGNIPPNPNASSHHSESGKLEDLNEMRKYVWEYLAQHGNQPYSEQSYHDSPYNEPSPYSQHHDHSQHQYTSPQSQYYDQLQQHTAHQEPHHDHRQQHTAHQEPHHDHRQQYTAHQTQHYDHQHNYFNDSPEHNSHRHDYFSEDHKHTKHTNIEHNQSHQHVHVNHVRAKRNKKRDRRSRRVNRIDVGEKSQVAVNGDASDTDSDIYDDIIPRHPYDGFYMRHRPTIDSYGRKLCLHEIPPTPSPSPPSSPIIPTHFTFTLEDLANGHSGVAGNLARVLPGASGQREALDELTRRQGWEAGNIDYMGADSFENIWAKISQTLSKTRTSPPKQSPPKEVSPPAPVEVQSGEVFKGPVKEPVEVAKEATPIEVSAPKEPVAPASEAEVPTTVEEAVVEPPVTVEAVAPTAASIPETPAKPAAAAAAPPKREDVPLPVETASIPEPKDAAPVPATVKDITPVTVVKQAEKKTETLESAAPVAAPTKVEPPKETLVEAPKVVEPIAPASPAPAAVAPASPAKPQATPEKSATGSPPLANTPSKEEAPSVPEAKLEERRKPGGKLKLAPPAVSDPLPTPDSELAASELRTPTVSCPSPAAVASPPPLTPQQERLAVQEPEVPTPPVGAVSLAQIGVKPKGKATTAAQIESSVTEKTEPASPATPTSPTLEAASADPPKKKVVKKVVKKTVDAAGGEAPVPPPRKKAPKPKEK